jgi:hypothetical protein
MEPRASCMVRVHLTTELLAQPRKYVIPQAHYFKV